MRTRAIKDGEVIWFGSYGKNQDGTAKFYNSNKNSFSSRQEGVKDSLIERLSILKGELWYRASYGIPLFEKTHSKALIDSFVASTVTNHPDVTNVESFESKVINHNYTCNMKIVTTYGEINLQI